MVAVKVGLNNDDKEKLIYFVQRFPALYDKTSVKYRNRKLTDDAWRAIADLFEKYGEFIAVVNFALRLWVVSTAQEPDGENFTVAFGYPTVRHLT